MDRLGSARGGHLDPGRAARPPRCRAGGDRPRRRRARALRPGDPQPAAHRGARGRGDVRHRLAEGLVGDAAQAQPDHGRADLRARPRPARLRADGARERRALARARHLALGRRAGRAARRDDPARLHAAPDQGPGRGHERPRRADAHEPRADARCAVQPARADRADRGRAARATTPIGSSRRRPRARGTPGPSSASCWPRRSPRTPTAAPTSTRSTSTRSSTTTRIWSTCRTRWRGLTGSADLTVGGRPSGHRG